MKDIYQRIIRLMWGLFLYSFGILLTVNAHIGYAPWDVLHVGIADTVGLTIGSISILLGIFIVIITVLLGEKVGLGTICNMIFIGLFFDSIYALKIIPVPENTFLAIVMLITGLFIIAFATYFYISTGFGAGPRDGLMVALARITKLPIGICRGVIEFMAVVSGWLLGGMVGIGTVLAAFGIGFCVQITFYFLKFDATKVEHETIAYTYRKYFKKEIFQSK
ncbi:MAG: hypothetical protein PHQ99_06200 [Atribacterota bacterium]|nr:hypothetical protein [Atribacterota bacterium]MDD4289161.1 hypothetical protein [Atribacterota bacterium]